MAVTEYFPPSLQYPKVMAAQPDTAPSPKRVKLETEEENYAVNIPPSWVGEPERAQKFILAKFLPENVAKPSLQKPDELQQKLVQCLESTLERGSFLHQLKQLNLTLPEKYASSLENGTSFFSKLVQSSTEMLAKKGVTKVKEVVLPSVDVQELPGLLSGLEINQGFHLESIEVPFKSLNKELLLKHIQNVIEPLRTCFRASSAINLCDPSKTQPDLKLTDPERKDLLKKLKSKSPGEPDITYGKAKEASSAQSPDSEASEALDKKDTPSSDSEVSEASDKKDTPSSDLKASEASDKKDQVLLTSDSKELPLEVSDRITAYGYWDLKDIHEKYGYTGNGTVVAVIDTGVDLRHPAFHPVNAKIAATCNFAEPALDCTSDENGHGTSCAGIACGNRFSAYSNPQNESSEQFSVLPGVAPGAKLVVCKVTRGSNSTVLPEAVVKALKYIKDNHTGDCASGVDVVSISFGSYAYSEPITRAITDLISVGVIVVCAACNDGHKFHTPICYPARLGHVLCIGSHGAHGKSSLFSPVGQELDFLAPGEHIVAPGRLEYQGEAESGNGTSYATPAVAGLICLILECLRKEFPDKASKYQNHWVMKELLREMSTNGGTHSNDRGFGALEPIRFFRQPECFVRSIDTDILNPGQ